MNDYTTSFVVDQAPNHVFEAINNVRGWWGRTWKATTRSR